MDKRHYKHMVKYYETDQMGVAHHSNYVRWFEDSRIDFMRNYDIDCQKLEDMGIIIPVTGYSCKNKKPARFGNELDIEIIPAYFNGVRMEFEYIIRFAQTQEVCATGETGHCFVNGDMVPMNLKKAFPEIYADLKNIFPVK